MNTAPRLDAALKAAGVPILGVSIGDEANRATWRVSPASLQAQAQPTIDAFDPNAQSVIDADVAAQAALTAQQKDLVATLGLVAQQTDPNWGTKTLAQKIAAVRALQTSWQAMRAFVEKNL